MQGTPCSTFLKSMRLVVPGLDIVYTAPTLCAPVNVGNCYLPVPSATEPRANLHATAAIACTGTVHLYIIYMWEQAAHNSSWHSKQQGQICLRNECSRTVPERRLRTIRGEMG